MSLVLGIFNKKGESIDQAEFLEVLEEFDYQGKRGVQTAVFKNLLISTARAQYEPDSIAVSHDRSFVCAVGGEIYDPESAISDLKGRGYCFQDEKNPAELLIQTYRHYPHSFCADLNAIFGFILFDINNQELIVGNDPFGLYPLFVYDTDDVLIVCSEWEPIIKYRSFDFTLDHYAIAEFYLGGMPLGDKTFFKHIKNLAPATLMRFKQSLQMKGEATYDCRVEQYEDHAYPLDHKHDVTYFAERIARLIFKAVQRRVERPEIILADLTGGADTRLLLGNLTDEQRSAMTFYTYGSKWTPDEENRELIIARMLAKKYGLQHQVESLYGMPEKTFDEGWFDTRRIVFLDKKRISGGITLGEGVLAQMNKQSEKVLKFKINLAIRFMFSRKFRHAVHGVFNNYKNDFNKLKAEDKLHLFNIFQGHRGFFTTINGGTRAGWHDPYSNSLRSDSFFWDMELLKFLMTIPEEMFMKRKLFLELYHKHYNHLLEIPTTRVDMNMIKIGINPLLNRKPDYQTALNRIMQDDATWEKDFYNRKFVESTVKKPDDAFTKAFIDFEIWYRRFVKQP